MTLDRRFDSSAGMPCPWAAPPFRVGITRRRARGAQPGGTPMRRVDRAAEHVSVSVRDRRRVREAPSQVRRSLTPSQLTVVIG